MSDTTAIQRRDEQIVAALEAGQSVRTVQRQFKLTVAELDEALERAFPLDNAARLRTIRGDLSRLDKLIEKFYAKALADDGINSATFATLVVKAWERKANLLGLDAVRQVDLQLIRPPDAPTQHERIRQAILSMVEREQPERRAAIRRLDQLGPERALELLGPFEGDGDGTEPWPEDAALK